MDYILERFSEPSSWAGITGGLATLGFNLPPGVGQAICYLGAGLTCLASFFVKERINHKNDY